MIYGSLPSRFLQAIDERPSPRAQLVRRSEGWEPISSQEFLRRVAGLANALVELGVKPGDRVGLFAPTVPNGIPPTSPSAVPAPLPFPSTSTSPWTAWPIF